MAEGWRRQHALAHRALDARRPAPDTDAGVRLWLEPAAAQLCLRGDGGGGLAAAVKRVLELPLPVAANTVSGTDGRRILWLGPDEWLAVCPGEDAAALARALEDALAGMHALVSDVSSSRAVIGLEGSAARQVLMKGCSLDLDPVAFAPGRCAQTALARAHMLLHQVSDTPRYHVYAHRSFADYVFAWLEDAASEFGVVVGGP